MNKQILFALSCLILASSVGARADRRTSTTRETGDTVRRLPVENERESAPRADSKAQETTPSAREAASRKSQ